MTYRVEVIASVRRVGVVEIEAESQQEARECVARLGAEEGYTALPITWIESTRLGPLEIMEVREAA